MGSPLNISNLHSNTYLQKSIPICITFSIDFSIDFSSTLTPFWKPSWAILGRLGGVLGHLGAVLGRLRGALGASGARFSWDSILDTILYPICNRSGLDFDTVETRKKALRYYKNSIFEPSVEFPHKMEK